MNVRVDDRTDNKSNWESWRQSWLKVVDSVNTRSHDTLTDSAHGYMLQSQRRPSEIILQHAAGAWRPGNRSVHYPASYPCAYTHWTVQLLASNCWR